MLERINIRILFAYCQEDFSGVDIVLLFL
jgi:hypothetical protein